MIAKRWNFWWRKKKENSFEEELKPIKEKVKKEKIKN